MLVDLEYKGMSIFFVNRIAKAFFSLSPSDREYLVWSMQLYTESLDQKETGTLSADGQAYLDAYSVVSDSTRPDDERMEAIEQLREQWRDATTDRKGLQLLRGGRSNGDGNTISL